MWTDEQQIAIVHYTLQQLSRDELLKTLSTSLTEIADEFHRQLILSLQCRHADLVEAALLVAHGFKIPVKSYLDLACQLLHEDWHYKHEDLIADLQDAADPKAIPAIKKAIDLKPILKYLDYDDYGSYYKKCLWALQAIGTPEAIKIIEACALSQDRALRDQAVYRLSKIEPIA